MNTTMTIQKHDTGNWIFDYTPTEGSQVGGMRQSCNSKIEAIAFAHRFCKETGIPVVVEILE